MVFKLTDTSCGILDMIADELTAILSINRSVFLLVQGGAPGDFLCENEPVSLSLIS